MSPSTELRIILQGKVLLQCTAAAKTQLAESTANTFCNFKEIQFAI